MSATPIPDRCYSAVAEGFLPMRLGEMAILWLVLLLACGCAQPPVPRPARPRIQDGAVLRYIFVPGQRTRYVLRSGFSSQTPGAPEAVISVSQEVEITQTILASLPSGGARVGLVVDRFKAVTSTPGQPSVEFDSGEDPEGKLCPTELRGMASLVGKEVEVLQYATGEIQAVAGLAAIYRRAVNQLSPTESQSLEHFLRELSHKPRGLFGLGVSFPREPVTPGRQWATDRGPFPLFCGQLVYRCRYELRDLSGGMASIEFTDDSGEAKESAESTWKPLWTTRVHGTISFDTEKGLLSQMRGESTTYLQVAGKMELRSKTAWELSLLNDGALTTDSTAQSSAENAIRK